MKKILIGLMAVSAVSFAELPNLGETPDNGKYVFTNQQYGAIKVTGKVTSDIPVIKYVVFASTGDGSSLNSADTVLNLSDFVISGATPGFIAQNPSIYVRQIGTNNALTVPTGTVQHKLTFDRGWTGPASSSKYTDFISERLDCYWGLFMNRASLTEKLAGVSGVTLSEWGAVVNEDITEIYPSREISIINDGNGKISLITGQNIVETTGLNVLPAEKISAVDQVFAGGLPLKSDLTIEVRVR